MSENSLLREQNSRTINNNLQSGLNPPYSFTNEFQNYNWFVKFLCIVILPFLPIYILGKYVEDKVREKGKLFRYLIFLITMVTMILVYYSFLIIG